jgi:hypothetical protein
LLGSKALYSAALAVAIEQRTIRAICISVAVRVAHATRIRVARAVPFWRSARVVAGTTRTPVGRADATSQPSRCDERGE